ncbi:MAG: dipicolinate synthase subunit DpsA [Clostridia bacterium]|nr:dipicolinate synthase subunit DpsA [Clostridia bacterium]
MNKVFSVIGGDMRIIYLAKMLAKDKNIVYSYGFEKTKELENVLNIHICDNIDEAINNSNIVISSVPLTKNGADIYMPFSDNIVKIDNFLLKLQNKTFIAGAIKEELLQKVNQTKIVDLMNVEELTVLNTIATAEGAISDIILNTEKNLHGSKVLILGFGRVSKVLAKKLKAIEAQVTCAARKEVDFAWMETLGYNITNINYLGDNLKEYDIIINTVPYIILDNEKLSKIKNDCFLLDLASKPGGFDQEYINQNKLNYKWSLAIPGKVSPISSAQFIKNVIDKLLKKEEE